MIGNIRRPNPLKPFDPSEYFDPTTNTCTEANFIKILEHGYYDSSLIGKFVTLSNTVDYDNGKWVIADVDHDSENTGQTNCYDLISANCFYNTQFSDIQTSNSCTPKKWLLNTFYPGFSTDFKAHTIKPKYKYTNTQYNDAIIILPSSTEVGTNTGSYIEGIVYPIFTNDSSRIKNDYQQLRSTYSSYECMVSINGSVTYTSLYSSNYLAPILRVQ